MQSIPPGAMPSSFEVVAPCFARQSRSPFKARVTTQRIVATSLLWLGESRWPGRVERLDELLRREGSVEFPLSDANTTMLAKPTYPNLSWAFRLDQPRAKAAYQLSIRTRQPDDLNAPAVYGTFRMSASDYSPDLSRTIVLL